jgi:excisionase family DNA binding protein
LIDALNREVEKQMSEKEELIEPETVARILDCTPEEVIQLARNGELRATRMGRLWRFRLQDVVAHKSPQAET